MYGECLPTHTHKTFGHINKTEKTIMKGTKTNLQISKLKKKCILGSKEKS